MTVTKMRLDDALQALVDARLDTIDRMLMGHLPRRDRLAIVQDVEAQIDEMLDGLGAEGVTREALMAILSRMDPPEAYIPEAGGQQVTPKARQVEVSARLPDSIRVRPADRYEMSLTSAIVAMISLALSLATIAYVVAATYHYFNRKSDLAVLILIFAWFTLTFSGGSAAALLGGINWRRKGGAWAMTGLVVGSAAVLVTLLGVIYLYSLM
jgi:hypothetical protein